MQKRNKWKFSAICTAPLLVAVIGFSAGAEEAEPGSAQSNAAESGGGYGMRSPEGGTFLGRYRLSSEVLVDAGWKNVDNRWTEKAERNGIYINDDFLESPDAQEQALTDLLQRIHDQLRHDGSLGRNWKKTIVDSRGQRITVTEAGLNAAALRVGAIAVHKYFDPAERKSLNGDQIEFIEGRLRDFAGIAYDSAANAHEADTGKTDRDAEGK